jgi:hypothetical protein
MFLTLLVVTKHKVCAVSWGEGACEVHQNNRVHSAYYTGIFAVMPNYDYQFTKSHV